jgi:hypothetical protein
MTINGEQNMILSLEWAKKCSKTWPFLGTQCATITQNCLKIVQDVR